MSSALLNELLADFTAPLAEAWSAQTPAKAAKAAKPEHSCGPAPLSGPCEALRISANAGQREPATEPDSQTFAAVRRPQTELRTEQTCGSSRDSQNWQGCPPTNAAAGTNDRAPKEAAAPVLAGPKDASRPYRPMREQGDRCHAGGWNDAELGAFGVRHARLLRAGYGNDDAEDLAERLTLRDRDADQRVSCIECRHYRPGRCGNHKRAGFRVADVGRDLAATLQRCAGFELMREAAW